MYTIVIFFIIVKHSCKNNKLIFGKRFSKLGLFHICLSFIKGRVCHDFWVAKFTIFSAFFFNFLLNMYLTLYIHILLIQTCLMMSRLKTMHMMKKIISCYQYYSNSCTPLNNITKQHISLMTYHSMSVMFQKYVDLSAKNQNDRSVLIN